jgi:hypothetical protein
VLLRPSALADFGIDATAKRHYNYFVIYEWDEQQRIGNLEKHGLDKERRISDAALKNR